MLQKIDKIKEILRVNVIFLASTCLLDRFFDIIAIAEMYTRHVNQALMKTPMIKVMNCYCPTNSVRLVHSTSYTDVTSKGRSVERHSYVRFGRNVDATSFLRPRRIRTSGKLTYGPK